MSNPFTTRFNNLSPEQRSYALQDLAQHLYQADDSERLHGLMIEDWMRARSTHDEHYGGFLSDVQLAWSATEQHGVSNPRVIGWQVRYALLQSSINSLATNILPEVLVAGLRLGRWSASTALIYAQQIAHSVPRLGALTQVATFLHEHHEEELASEVFTEALAGLREIPYPINYVEAVLALAIHLPPHLLVQALAAAQEIADAKERAKIIGALSPRLPADLFYEVLEMVRGFEDSDNRALALSQVVPYLPPDLLRDALEIAQDCAGAKAKAVALVALLPHLPQEYHREAVAIFRSIYDELYASVVLLALPGQRDPEELLTMSHAALAQARDASDIEDRSDGIALLAPYLPSELLPEAVAIARTIGDGEPYDALYRSRALAALAPHVPQELQAELLAEMRTWPLAFYQYCADVLAALAPHLSQNLMPQALDVVFARESTSGQESSRRQKKQRVNEYPADQIPDALASLAPNLPADLVVTALMHVKEMPGEDARADALTILAPYLPETLLPDALESARKIDTSLAGYRSAALAALAQRGVPAALDEALKAAQQGQEADENIIALPALLAAGALVSSPQQRPELVEEALKAAREIRNTRYRAQALTMLLQGLPSEFHQTVLDEALPTAREIGEPGECFQALSRLVPYLPLEQRSNLVDEILRVARRVDFGVGASNALIAQALLLPALAPYLPPERQEQALKAARAARNPALRGKFLAALVPHLPSDERSKVLDEALKAARKIDADDREQAIEVLALVVPEVPTEQRRALLEELFAAINKVNRMYQPLLGPTLAALIPYVPSDFIPATLALAREIWSPHALAALIPHVPVEERQGVLDEAIVAARAVKAPLERAHLLSLLLPHAEADRQVNLFEEVLQTLQHLDFPVNLQGLSQTFAALVPLWAKLPRGQALAMWQSILHAYAAQRRTYLLVALIGLTPVIKELGSEEAFKDILRSILEVCRQWSWI
jgi:hypothetical protein